MPATQAGAAVPAYLILGIEHILTGYDHLVFLLGLVVVQGWLADSYGLQTSFLLTAACELYVLFYAVWGSKPVVSGGEPATESRQIG